VIEKQDIWTWRSRISGLGESQEAPQSLYLVSTTKFSPITNQNQRKNANLYTEGAVCLTLNYNEFLFGEI
jgi:hypothetical protein